MENRTEHTESEGQGWGAYVTPPRYPSQSPAQWQQEAALRGTLCAQVGELLPALLENDGEVRPEMAASVYAHLSVCSGCSRSFEEMQRVVAMVEALAPAEMPMDFSGIIMRRIQTEMGPLPGAAPPRPIVAASSAVREEVAPEANRQASAERIAAFLTEAETADLRADTVQVGIHVETLTQTTQSRVERLTAAGLLAAVLTFCLSTSWGRAMLGVNIESASAWFTQIQAALQSVPVLGGIVAVVFAALTQVGRMLGDTYRNLGAMVAKGVIVDVALCAAGYYYLSRRQRRQMHGF